MRGIKDKVVIITGAGRGIGAATAARFAEEGAKVVIAERDEDAGIATAKRLTDAGGEALLVTVDIADRESVKQMLATVVERYGRVDVLINNAGILADASLAKMTDEQFDKVIAVNLKGTFIATQEIAAKLKEQGDGGVILNAASVVALYGNFGQTNYVASKAGVIGMTKTWARELGKANIRVNAIAPGFIRTDMTESMPPKILESLVAKVPLRRMGEPGEVAGLYAFLASDDARYISGTCISIDGSLVV